MAIPEDIEEALAVYLPASPLAALIGHSEVTPKFWAAEAPNDLQVTLPYLVYFQVTGEYAYESRDDLNEAGSVEDGDYQVSVFASTRAQARKLRRAALKALNDAPLTISDGEQFYFRGKSLGFQIDPTKGPGGTDVFQEILTFRCVTDRSFPLP